LASSTCALAAVGLPDRANVCRAGPVHGACRSEPRLGDRCEPCLVYRAPGGGCLSGGRDL